MLNLIYNIRCEVKCLVSSRQKIYIFGSIEHETWTVM